MDELLTQEEIEKCVFFLGYPSKVLREKSTHYNRIVINRFKNISQETATRVQELIVLIETARTNLDKTQLDAHVANIDEISLDTSRAVSNVERQYARYRKELSYTLDIPIRRHGSGGGRLLV